MTSSFFPRVASLQERSSFLLNTLDQMYISFLSMIDPCLLTPSICLAVTSRNIIAWLQLVRLFELHSHTMRFFWYCSSAFLYYDHLLTFAQELEVIWKAKPSFVNALFILNRYITFFGYVPILIFLFYSPSDDTVSYYYKADLIDKGLRDTQPYVMSRLHLYSASIKVLSQMQCVHILSGCFKLHHPSHNYQLVTPHSVSGLQIVWVAVSSVLLVFRSYALYSRRVEVVVLAGLLGCTSIGASVVSNFFISTPMRI